MLNEEQKNNLIANLKKARQEVNQLKDRLRKSNSEKESWFRKKSAIGEEIKNKIINIKSSKKKRNSLTSEVKSTKK